MVKNISFFFFFGGQPLFLGVAFRLHFILIENTIFVNGFRFIDFCFLALVKALVNESFDFKLLNWSVEV